jgi:hypothetical protein
MLSHFVFFTQSFCYSAQLFDNVLSHFVILSIILDFLLSHFAAMSVILLVLQSFDKVMRSFCDFICHSRFFAQSFCFNVSYFATVLSHLIKC